MKLPTRLPSLSDISSGSFNFFPEDGHTGEGCQLFDGFALGIQFLLGSLALASLLLKRYHEHPRRPPLIWFFDVSKQAFGGSLVHMLNVGVSIFSGGETSTTRNPCVWYLLNLLLDTTLGVGVLYVVLNFLHNVLDNFGFHSIVASGYYGKPPKASIWGGQFLVFLSGLILMKLLVVLILTMFPIILLLGQFFLSPFERLEDPRYQVVVVMLLVPLVMNVVQFWLTDHIIKARPTIPPGITTDNSDGFMNSSEPLLSVSGSNSSSPIHSPQFGPSLNDYDSD